MDGKNILVCVSGLTPQIVTEALYCLSVKEKIEIDAVYVLTTLRGKDVIEGKDKAQNTPKTSLKYEIAEMCKKYKLTVPVFEENEKHIIVATEETVELYDIRNDVQNTLFPNKTAEFLRNITAQPSNNIFCCISGGRKSMSVHIAFALSIFGRNNDRLLHVLTSDKNEFKGFYPVNKQEDKALEIADIPFIRLRSILAPEVTGDKLFTLKYSELVGFTQERLAYLTDENRIIADISSRELRFENKVIKLEPLEFAIYFQFIELRLSGKNKISINEITAKDFALKLKNYLDEYYPYYSYRESQREKWWRSGLPPEGFRSKRSKINLKISSMITDDKIADKFKIESNRRYNDTDYLIKALKESFQIIYP